MSPTRIVPPAEPTATPPTTDQALSDLELLAWKAEVVQALAEALFDMENQYMSVRSEQSKAWLMDSLMKQRRRAPVWLGRRTRSTA